MNFLGAAFGFGARDVGLKAATNSATKNLDKINSLLEDQSDIANKSKVSGLMERIKQFNVASIAGNVRQLTGETGNLSNSLESMAVSYAQTAKPIVASMDLTGKEAKKMTGRVVGMAIGLNTSADAVAETFKAIHDAGGPAKSAIDAMGYSEKEWVKITQTTGVTMQDFAGMMGDMVASWGASPKKAALMADNIMAIGKAAKVGTSAIKGAKGQLDALDAIFEQLPPSMARTADEVQSLMESTYKLAGAFKEMGETEEQATALGQDTAKMFAEQAVLVDKLYAMGGDQALEDSPLFKFLTMLGVGTEEARDIISTGSKDVVAGVTKINEVFQRMGGDSSPQVQHALAGLNQAMGQSAAGLGWLASNTDTGTKALAAMANMTVKGEGALKRYGDQAYSSGRTLQESFDLAKESFQTQFRSIGRADVRGFVGKQMKAYRSMGKQLKELGKDETFGPIIKKLSIMNQMGAKGVFMSFADDLGLSTKKAMEMGVGLELAMDTARQLGDEFAPIMELMGTLGPLGTLGVVGGVASFFLLDESDRNEIFGSFAPIINSIAEKVKGIWDNLPWDKIEGAFEKVAGKVSEYVGSLVKRILVEISGWLSDAAPDFARAIGLDKATKLMKDQQKIQDRAEKIIADREALAQKLGEDGALDISMQDAQQMAKAEMAQEKKLATISKKRADYESRIRVAGQAYGRARGEGKGKKRAAAEGVSALGSQWLMQEAVKTKKGESKFFDKQWEAASSPFGVFDFMKDVPGVKYVGEQMMAGVMETEATVPTSITQMKQSSREVVASVQDTITEGWNAISQASEEGGRATLEMFGVGIEEAAPDTVARTQESMQQVANQLGGSLPSDGPLANGDPAYFGALSIMETFSQGLIDSTEVVREAMAQTLDDSVIATFEEYGAKVEEMAQKKSLLKSIASQMVRDFGGKLDLGTIQVEGEQSLSAKETFEAALNIPGLAGVIAAIASDGHKTRILLKKIQDNTQTIADSDLIKNTKVESSGALTTLPS